MTLKILYIAIRSEKDAISKEDMMIIENMIKEIKHPSTDKINIYFGRYQKDEYYYNESGSLHKGAAWGLVYKVPVEWSKASYFKSIFHDMGYDVPENLTQRQYLRRI